MDIPKISAHLRDHHYCHRRDYGALIGVEPGQEQSFRAYWANLVRDEAFKAYTHRERRILRYRLLPSRQLQLDRNTAFTSPVTYAVNYRQGVNHLSYCEDGFIEHPLMQKLLATDLAVIAHPRERGTGEYRSYTPARPNAGQSLQGRWPTASASAGAR